ncbi:hypothetical protein D3C73_516290 [compost metagenome]
MVAFGEDGNRIHVTQLQHLLKLLFVKTGSDRCDGFGGVIIEMNLTKSHVFPSFPDLIPSV